MWFDKTSAIEALLEVPQKTVLLLAPHQWGKSRFLNTMQMFLDRKFASSLANSGVGRTIANISSRFCQYCTIYLTFEVLSQPYSTEGVKDLIGHLFYSIIDADKKTILQLLPEGDRDLFERSASSVSSLLENLPWVVDQLLLALRKESGRPVIIMIDEYDRPFSRTWGTDQFESTRAELLQLYRLFDENRNVHKLFLAGVFPYAANECQLSYFMVDLCTQSSLGPIFGLCQEQTDRILEAEGLCNHYFSVARYYGGYRAKEFAQSLFNPWSVRCFLRERALVPYWNSPDEEQFIVAHLAKAIKRHKKEIALLIDKGVIPEAPIDGGLLYEGLSRDDSTPLWSTLFYAGFVTGIVNSTASLLYNAHVPNVEVRRVLERIVAEVLLLNTEDHLSNELSAEEKTPNVELP